MTIPVTSRKYNLLVFRKRISFKYTKFNFFHDLSPNIYFTFTGVQHDFQIQ